MSSLRYLIATSIYPLAAFALSLILTRICIAVLPRLGYMDIPKGRHIHKVAVPRAGGIGFILAFWITVFLYAVKYYSFSGLLQEPIGQFLVPLAGGSVILFFTGLYDDRYDMPSVIKLMFQIAALPFQLLGWLVSAPGRLLFPERYDRADQEDTMDDFLDWVEEYECLTDDD